MSYTYVLLRFKFGNAYQEALNGNVTRYVDLAGNELFTLPPEGDGGELVDANPARISWML